MLRAIDITILALFSLIVTSVAVFIIDFVREFLHRRTLFADRNVRMLFLLPAFVFPAFVIQQLTALLQLHLREILQVILSDSPTIDRPPICIVDNSAVLKQLKQLSQRFPFHSHPTSGPKITLRDASGKSIDLWLLRDWSQPTVYWVYGVQFISPEANKIGAISTNALDHCG